MGGGLIEPADGARGSVRTGDLGRALLDLEGAGETIEETLASIGQGQRPGERLRPGPADALGDSLSDRPRGQTLLEGVRCDEDRKTRHVANWIR